MNFLEKDLEEIIFHAPQEEIRNRGLHGYTYDKIFRQLNLGKYGKADLVTVKIHFESSMIIVCIYELKQDIINVNTFLQAVGYLRGIASIINKILPDGWIYLEEIALVGKKIDSVGNFCFLNRHICNLTFYTYTYEFDGIKFNSDHSYYMLDNVIPDKTLTNITDLFNSPGDMPGESDPIRIEAELKDDLPF